jgi:FlaA1/EpsC-like NDP-sugar epimerase
VTPFWSGASVLVTGVCGTVGAEILNQLARLGPARIVGIDSNESALFFLRERYAGREEIDLRLGDVRDHHSVFEAAEGVDVILHTAALKHVALCERSPRQAVNTNVLGTQNVIDVALARGVKKLLFTSSDKAVNPTSVMGTSKLMCERLVTAANERRSGPAMASTRFGNVLGSSGSVIPLFRKQIAAGGPVTLTDERMTRFIMSLGQAVQLVLQSCAMAQGGEVFVMKMPVARILDLAHVMIGLLAGAAGRDPREVEIRRIGPRPGEKLFEELLGEEEVRRTLESDRFLIVQPALRPNPGASYGVPLAAARRPYNSSLAPAMERAALADYLVAHRLVEN